jgi:maleylpyruvate isomerase
VKLYGYWRSSASWRVRIALHHKGIPFESVPVNLLTGENREAAHLARSPLGQVPVLELDDGRFLTQSLAIMDFLDDMVPHPAVLPADPMGRAQVWAMAEVINSGTQPLQNLSVLKKVSALGGDRLEWGKTVIHDGLIALQTLSEPTRGMYLYGDIPTMADMCLVPQLYNARRFQVDLAELKALVAIEARCEALDAFHKAHPDQQIDAT